jgi:iron-sulfur cluster assembly protein
MLTITQNAAEAINTIISSSPMPDGAGMRISATPIDQEHASLELALAEGPAERDEVVEEAGAQVFLEPQVATLLDDKTLDAIQEPEGFRFSVGEGQAPIS